jgi:hypothetical protein
MILVLLMYVGVINVLLGIVDLHLTDPLLGWAGVARR